MKLDKSKLIAVLIFCWLFKSDTLYANNSLLDINLGIPPNRSTLQYIKVTSEHPQVVHIHLSIDGISWSTYKISNKKVITFLCNDFKFIRIDTQHPRGQLLSSQYTISCQSRYSVWWNDKEQKWDIYLLSE